MTTEHQSDQAFISTREAAELLGVSVRTVQLWVENGTLHAWKTAGGHRRIVRGSIDAVLADQQAIIETVVGLRALRVLLIDDNRTQLNLYKLKLESLSQPLLLTTAGSGIDGMLEVGRLDPDVVIVSLDLAGIDVIEMIGSIRKAEPRALIIGLTTASEAEVAEYTRALPDIHICDPIDGLDTIWPLLKESLKEHTRPRAGAG